VFHTGAFGTQVGRINVTRRQLRLEDKRLAQELSSGDAKRFRAAIESLIDRGAIRRGSIDEAVHLILCNRNGKKPVDTIVLSSTHRLAERVSESLAALLSGSAPSSKPGKASSTPQLHVVKLGEEDACQLSFKSNNAVVAN
jgi:hypothetical protein